MAGPDAQICELTDFICAARLEKEIDSEFQDSPNQKHNAAFHRLEKVLCMIF